MWLCREKIEKSKLPAFVRREVWWLLGGKYKCVFSAVIYSNSLPSVANHTNFLLFLYALKAGLVCL